MHAPSALSTQNSPFNPDRRSPKSVAAVSVISVPSVRRTPVPTAPISLLSHLCSVPSTAAPRHSPLATRHSPITPFAEFSEAPKEKDHCFALLLLALGPLLLHSFHSLLTLFSLSPLLATLTNIPRGGPPPLSTLLNLYLNSASRLCI